MARPRNPKTDPASDEFEPELVVSTHWPRNFTTNRLHSAVRTVDELLRWACHGLINKRSRSEMLQNPSDIGVVVGNFNASIHKMDQVLNYLAVDLRSKAAADAVYHHDIAPRERWEPHGTAFAKGAAEGTAQAFDRARAHLLAAAHELGATGIGALGTLDPKERPADVEKPRALRVVSDEG
jgi:hypothetical protein